MSILGSFASISAAHQRVFGESFAACRAASDASSHHSLQHIAMTPAERLQRSSRGARRLERGVGGRGGGDLKMLLKLKTVLVPWQHTLGAVSTGLSPAPFALSCTPHCLHSPPPLPAGRGMRSRKESRSNVVSNSQKGIETRSRILMVFFCLFSFSFFPFLVCFPSFLSFYFIVVSSPTTGALRSVLLISLSCFGLTCMHFSTCASSGSTQGVGAGGCAQGSCAKEVCSQLQLMGRLLCFSLRLCVEVKPFPE